MNTTPTLLTTLALLASASICAAHTRLVQSTPAADSRVAAPQKLELKFSDLSQLQGLTLQRGSDAPRPVTPLPQQWGSEFSVALPQLAAGEYVATWSVETDDGHTSTGKIRFTVTGPATSASDTR